MSSYDLFEILLKRSEIECENQVIDSVVFFTCFRFMMFCDEVHDFRSEFPEEIINYILVERLSEAENNIFDFINKIDDKDIVNGINEVKKKYESGNLCKSLYHDTTSDTYFNSLINKLEKIIIFQNQFIKKNKKIFITFILNFRYTFFSYIIRWFKLKKEGHTDLDLYVTLLLELNIIDKKNLDNIDKLLDDNKCKRFVKIVTEFIFGIINISEYNCKLENKLPNLIDVNKVDSNIINLFIDQIGGTKNYSSVLNTIHTIINNYNFNNQNQYALQIMKTNANTYDAAAPTSLEKLIKDSSNESNYNIKVKDNDSIFSIDIIQKLNFNKYPIIEFEFFYKENPLTKNQDIALRIYKYFGKNYNPQLEKIGGIKGEASKSKIANYISTNFYNSDGTYNIDLLDLFAYKTMGDFLQIISVKIFSLNNNVSIAKNLLSYNFITGDIICGYLGGIFLDNSILEKQTDDIGTLSTNLSLTTFYNINEIDKCIFNYLNLSKTNLSNEFKIKLNNIFIKKICHNFKDNLTESGYPKMRQKTFKEYSKTIPLRTKKLLLQHLQNKILKQLKPIKPIPIKPKPKFDKTSTIGKIKSKDIPKDDKKKKEEIKNFKDCVNNSIDELQQNIIQTYKSIIDKYSVIKVKQIYELLVTFLINNFLTELNISNLRDLNIDNIISKIKNFRSFTSIFKDRDLARNYPDIISTYEPIINYIKEKIKRCKENIIGGSSSGFGKYKKITKTKKINKNQKYNESITKLAKKYRISINKSTIKNIKNLQKLHKIAKKLKINITKKNKNGKRIYKSIKQLEVEIKKFKKLKKSNNKKPNKKTK